MNQTISKDGQTISICGYRWVDPEGRVESCRDAASCQICGQCSRLDGDHEYGHCTGHLGLNQFIRVPGSTTAKVRTETENRAASIRQPQRQAKRPRSKN